MGNIKTEPIKRLTVDNIISIFAVIIALAATTFGVINNCSQNSRIDELNSKIFSMNYQPTLKLVGEPEIEIKSIDSLWLPDSLYEVAKSRWKWHSKRVLYTNFNIKLKYTNVGNAVAEFRYLTLGDSSTNKNYARKVLLEEKFKKILNDPHASKFFSTELLPNKEDTLEMVFYNRTKLFFDGPNFKLHVIIYYTNQLGNYYDSYSIIEYRRKEWGYPFPYRLDEQGSPIGPYTIVPEIDSSNYTTIVNGLDPNNIKINRFRIIDPDDYQTEKIDTLDFLTALKRKNSYHRYSDEDSYKIKEYLD